MRRVISFPLITRLALGEQLFSYCWLELDRVGDRLRTSDRSLLCSDGHSRHWPKELIARERGPAGRLHRAVLLRYAADSASGVAVEVFAAASAFVRLELELNTRAVQLLLTLAQRRGAPAVVRGDNIRRLSSPTFEVE
jgi:hypothetical protein